VLLKQVFLNHIHVYCHLFEICRGSNQKFFDFTESNSCKTCFQCHIKKTIGPGSKRYGKKKSHPKKHIKKLEVIKESGEQGDYPAWWREKELVPKKPCTKVTINRACVYLVE
jgi:hypothetical protein